MSRLKFHIPCPLTENMNRWAGRSHLQGNVSDRLSQGLQIINFTIHDEDIFWLINLKCTWGLRCWPVACGMLFIPWTSPHFLQMLQDKWAKAGFGLLKWNPGNFTVRLIFVGRRNRYKSLKLSLPILIHPCCFLATLNLDLRSGISFISPLLICFWQTILAFTLTPKTGLSLTWELCL